MEFEILKTINFKILYSTPIHFGKIFFELLILINLWNSYEFYLKNILINEMYITMLQSDIAYYCFVECCNDNGLNNNIIRKIYNIINFTEKEEHITKNNFYNMIAIRSL